MYNESAPPRSLEQTKQWFFDNGISVTDWAKQNGFRPQQVYALLNGKTRGVRGSSHRVAVALGVKAAPAFEAAGPHFPIDSSHRSQA